MNYETSLESASDIKQYHIIDTLIEERATNLMSHPFIWRLLKKFCYPLLGYRRAVDMADQIAPLDGINTFNYLAGLLSLNVSVQGQEFVPRKGAVVAIANHPAGVADGLAVYEALKEVRPDICFVANRDALRLSPGLADCVIPVEWKEELRSPARGRETLRHIVEAFRADRLVVLFPSGRLARPSLTGLKERPWQPTALNLAQKYQALVMPIHITGHNTFFYYTTWYINTELKDITLFREFLNKKNKKYCITIGEPFIPEGDVKQETKFVKQFILNELPKGISRFR